MKIISLGWGVQSWTLAAMSALGELPRVDVAIHADTTFEMQGTYSFSEEWTPWLMFHGIHVVTVKSPSNTTNAVWNGKMIPAYTYNRNSIKRKEGKARRVCTQRWKVAPIRKYLQAHRNGELVEMWLGISTDEALRMKPSNVKYITNHWPLIDLNMSRTDCVNWLNERGLDVPVKSSCMFCPFHDTGAWRNLKMSGNGDWKKAVEVDQAIRTARPPYELYLHPSRQPLERIDFRNDEDRGQIRLWDEECEGICGL